MPELPEVETTRRGLLPHVMDKTVITVTVRQASLRWPVSPELAGELPGNKIRAINRRGKYLLLAAGHGTLMIHLGMSGSLRIVTADTAARKHDHVDIAFKGGTTLRFTDPRRFGCMLWLPGETGTGTPDRVPQHRLLDSLGPEPLQDEFNGDYLCRLGCGRKSPVKSFIMDSRVVVGVGNIYANEALFLAGIHPKRAAGRIASARYGQLAEAVKTVLGRAIEAGGTTLRDFTDSNGRPGYFKQSLHVYGRVNEACTRCRQPLKEIRLGGRSTVYCSQCQK